MYVWRITRQLYDPLDGEGARRVGGRWNSAGRPVVYTAGSQSLAILEALIHLETDLLPRDYMLYRLHVPDELSMTVITRAQLPVDWRAPGHDACRAIGDAWLAGGETALLRVPPAPLREAEECGYILNPLHPDARQVTVTHGEPFAFDLRLI